MSDTPTAFGANLPPWPQTDFAAYGEVEVKPLSRMQKLTGNHLSRNWLTIPHVTHHDEADVTELDIVRKRPAADGSDARITPLAFLVKASVAALRAHPQFNASLDPLAGTVVYKRYFNIGIAVDTPAGLLVPVLRSCDAKSVPQLADNIAAISGKARLKGLSMAEMSGGCFTISSLGGIGGTGFTPIINAPEVAILGVTKSQWKPTRAEDDRIAWRLMMPLSLSYDHRLINGADAARFVRSLADALGQPERLLA
jgi:pyruvate dehydrogenase E2 component (dihydrolipoamide acetyltransferase)